MKVINDLVAKLETLLDETREKHRELLIEENNAAFRKNQTYKEMKALEELIASYKEKVT